MEENRQKVVEFSNNQLAMLSEKRGLKRKTSAAVIDGMTKSQNDEISMLDCKLKSIMERDKFSSVENAVENAVPRIKLTQVEKLPTYITWIFLDR